MSKSEDGLEAFLQVIPLLKDILMDDIAVCVTDRTSYLCYRPGDTIDLKNYPGKLMAEDDPHLKCIRSGKPSYAVMSKELLGFPFDGLAYPIKDSSGRVLGAIGIARNLNKQGKIEEEAENIFSSLQETEASISLIAVNSQKISSSVKKIVESSELTERRIKETDGILKLIKDISVQSNMLAINASIEAVRAGAAGKGFAVVADEMRKLSQVSSDSANKISALLTDVRKAMEDVFREISTASTVAETQAAATQQINAALGEITSSSKEMLELAKISH
jgi:hypothetical protein